MLLAGAVISAVINLLLFAGLPFLFYFLYHRWRHKRGFREVARRAGLAVGDKRYLAYGAGLAVLAVAGLILWPPSVETLVRPGSPQRAFRGLGLGGPAIPMALLYGVVRTGFPEELLFRGLLAGSLSRRLSLVWADLLQALIFLVPHLLVLRAMPELWGLLPLVFVAALLVGWLRIKSGSILGPWLVHATANVTTCLSVAMRSAT
jgi:membrane protease YdiL (CAAX protease family)